VAEGARWISSDPFLKEFVKRKRFSSGLVRKGSAGRQLCLLPARWPR
jgi:hypothetical protein